jgi:hypothetical protein
MPPEPQQTFCMAGAGLFYGLPLLRLLGYLAGLLTFVQNKRALATWVMFHRWLTV